MFKGQTIALHEKNQVKMQMYLSCWALIYFIFTPDPTHTEDFNLTFTKFVSKSWLRHQSTGKSKEKKFHLTMESDFYFESNFFICFTKVTII